jgi:hypothetical protein
VKRQKYNSNQIEEELMEKLPDISPKRASFFKSSTSASPKVLLKNYEFSPDKAFANLTEKYAKKLRHNQQLLDTSLLFAER